MATGLGGPQSCDKAHGNPCGYCRLTMLDISDRFASVMREIFTSKEKRQLRRLANKMGPYNLREKPNN